MLKDLLICWSLDVPNMPLRLLLLGESEEDIGTEGSGDLLPEEPADGPTGGLHPAEHLLGVGKTLLSQQCCAHCALHSAE